MTAKPPRCAVCGKLVDSMKVEQDYPKNVIRITVRCHGAVDVVEIPRDGTVDISFKQAFSPRPMLPGAP